MKKFNLEMALEGKPVITRDGRKVEQIKYFENVEIDFPVFAVICGQLDCFTIDGNYSIPENDLNPKNLFMKPQTKTMWMAYQKIDSTGSCDTTALFSSKEDLNYSWAKELGWEIISVEKEV